MKDQRRELVAISQVGGASQAELARRFGISRKTLYKWRKRACEAGHDVMGQWAQDQSRRPATCPWSTSPEVQDHIARLRREHPCWGARKIRHLLEAQKAGQVPSASTISAILRRLGLLDEQESLKRKQFIRFERCEPNQMWQMDFKGSFDVGRQKCHPLTIVDDYSRYGLCVRALPGESAELTRPALVEVFRRYGLPDQMLVDNGSCWGRVEAAYTAFTAWLLRLGVPVSHCRPYHPQTKGKNERFNRTLKAEAIAGQRFATFEQCQARFDQFLVTYNTLRPHEALGMKPPASRYQLSSRNFPEHLEPIEYLEHDIVRKVGPAGFLSWRKQRFHVGRAFSGDPVAMRPAGTDGVYEVYYCHQRVAIIDLRDGGCRQT